MRSIFALVLIIGLGIAGLAVYMAMQQFNQYERDLAFARSKMSPNVETVPVYVTKKNFRYGEKLRIKDVRAVDWPVRGVPKTAFTTREDLVGDDEALERTVIRAMDAGEVILSTKVTKPGQDAGVASLLETGMRAFALQVNVVSGVSGFLRPGDRVDVIWNGKVNGQTITKIILNNVELIGIDQATDQDRNRATVARTVTVNVSAQTVTALVQAQATGKLVLSLVGVNDTESSGDISINTQELLGIEQVEKVEAKKCFQTVRKGIEKVVTEVACTQ